MMKDELLDEGRLQREIAQELADSGMPLRQALSLGKWLAHITVEQFKMGDLLSWLTVFVISNSAVKDKLVGHDAVRKAFMMLCGMREGAEKHVLDGFDALEHHHHMAKLVRLVAERKWDEAIAHVKLSELGSKASQD